MPLLCGCRPPGKKSDHLRLLPDEAVQALLERDVRPDPSCFSHASPGTQHMNAGAHVSVPAPAHAHRKTEEGGRQPGARPQTETPLSHASHLQPSELPQQRSPPLQGRTSHSTVHCLNPWPIKSRADFPGGPVVKNQPANAGDTGLTPLVWEGFTCHGATKPMSHNY